MAMMTPGTGEAPTLEQADIESRLHDVIASGTHRSGLIALFGRGSDGAATTPLGAFRVVATESELQLRRVLPAVDVDPKCEASRIVFLVPWTRELPLDIRGRFVRNGRVLDVGRRHRLRRVFNALEFDAAVVSSALADYVLRYGMAAPAAEVARLGGDAMWTTWLASECRVPVEGGLSLDTLLMWAVVDARGPAFRETLAGRSAASFRPELFAHLTARLGPAGPLVFAAWEAGAGRTLLAHAVVFETLASDAHDVAVDWVEARIKLLHKDLGVAPVADASGVARRLGEVCGSALRLIDKTEGKSVTSRQVLDEADTLVDAPKARARLVESKRLPSAWQARLAALGRHLSAAAVVPSLEALAAARNGLEGVTGHEFFRAPEHTAVVKRAEMALRLVAWLVARPDQEIPASPGSYREVERLARWYADEGGFVDWARQGARGTDDTQLTQGIQAVVTTVDKVRRGHDHTFANALHAWAAARRPGEKVIPIDQAFERLGARFLKENPDRRLLVLLFDGMAWTQAVELLESLKGGTDPWGPIAWMQQPKVKLDGFYPPVLAGMPTVTSVSRAAFFSGRSTTPGKEESTQNDVDRWADNKAAKDTATAAVKPQLLLHAHGYTSGGHVTADALKLVRDAAHRHVALVINAIDSSLKGDAQHAPEWTVDRIKPLRSLLDAARDAGRTVMIASDHGHVPADLFTSAGPGESARYRVWNRSGEAIRDFEVGFEAGLLGVWAPPGAHGIIALADDAHRYGGGAHAGEHGGATLAEVVAPTLLIGPESAAASSADKGLTLETPGLPSWWFFDATLAATAPAPPAPKPKPKPRPEKTEKNENQLALLPPEPPLPPPPPALPVVANPRRSAALASSEIFRACSPNEVLRNRALDVIDYLLVHDLRASKERLAAEFKLQVHRLVQLVTHLSELLNVDSYSVLSVDHVSGEIRLDLALLEQAFEVKL